MSYNVGSLAMDLNVDISSARSSVQRVSNIYRQLMTSAAKAPVDALKKGVKDVTKGWSKGMEEATRAGTATLTDGFKGAANGLKGSLQGALGGVFDGVLNTILNVSSQLMIAAAELKFNAGSSIIGGYANTILEGVNNYGQETRSLDLAELVLQISEGNGTYADRMEAYTGRLDKMNKNLTEIATELSYDRVTIARLVEGLAKTGVSEEELLGGNTAASRKGSLANQTAMLAEAMNILPGQINEAVKLMTLGKAAYGAELSNETIANTFLGVYANTAQEKERIKYGFQDALPAGQAAGVSFQDVAQLVTQLAKLSSFEVAGTLSKTLLQALATPNRLDSTVFSQLDPLYNSGDTTGQEKRDSFIAEAQKKGNLVGAFKNLYAQIEKGFEQGKLGSLSGSGSRERAASYFSTLDDATKKQLIEQEMAKAIGGGDTAVQSIRGLMASKPEDDDRLRNSLENFYSGRLEELGRDSPLEAFKAVKQSGFAGAMDLVGSSIDNVKKAIGETFEPALVGLVHLFKDVANELNNTSGLWIGGLQRVSKALMEFFNNEALVGNMADGISNLMQVLNSRLEDATEGFIEFASDPENIEKAFEQASDAANDLIDGFTALHTVMVSLYPVVDKLTGLLTTLVGTGDKDKQNRNKYKEELEKGEDNPNFNKEDDTSKDFNSSRETGVAQVRKGGFWNGFMKFAQMGGGGEKFANNETIEPIKNFDRVTRNLTDEERALIKSQLESSNKTSDGRKLNIGTGGMREKFQMGTIMNGMKYKDLRTEYVTDEEVNTPERTEAVENALSQIDVLPLTIDGQEQNFAISATGQFGDGNSNFSKITSEGLMPLDTKRDADLIAKVNEQISQRNLNVGNDSSSDLAVEAYGRFGDAKEVAEIEREYGTYKRDRYGMMRDKDGNAITNITRDEAIEQQTEASNKRINQVFGEGNAQFNQKDGSISYLNPEKAFDFTDFERMSGLIEVLNKDDDLAKQVRKDARGLDEENGTKIQAMLDLFDGNLKNQEGEKLNYVLTPEQFQTVLNQNAGNSLLMAKTIENDYMGNFDQTIADRIQDSFSQGKELQGDNAASESVVLESVQDTINKIKGEFESGELIGDAGKAFERYFEKQTAKVQEIEDPQERERQTNILNTAKLAAKQSLGADFSAGQNSGIAQELKEVQSSVLNLAANRLKIEQEIIQLRQKGIEMERETLIQASSHFGKVNQGLLEVVGLLNGLDSAEIQNRVQIQNLDEQTKSKTENVRQKYSKIQGNEEAYGNGIIIKPFLELGKDGEEFVNLQKQVIDYDAAKREEINKNLESAQNNFVAKLRNVAERMFESFTKGFQTLTNSTLSSESGESTNFSNQANRLLESTQSSVVSMLQNIQTLRTIDSNFAGNIDTGKLDAASEALESIPDMFEDTLNEVYESFAQELSKYTNSLIDLEKRRNIDNLKAFSAGTESRGSLIRIREAGLRQDQQLRERNEDMAKLARELSSLNRRLASDRAASQFTPNSTFFKAREESTRAAAVSVRGRMDLLGVAKDADAEQNYKETLSLVFNTTKDVISDIEKTKNAFGSVSSEAINFENRLKSVVDQTNEWSQTAAEVKKILEEQYPNTGVVDTDNFVKFVEQMAELTEEIKDIALTKALMKITREIEDYSRQVQAIRSQGLISDNNNEARLIRSETSGESYRSDIKLAMLEAQNIVQSSNQSINQVRLDKSRGLDDIDLEERELRREFKRRPQFEEGSEEYKKSLAIREEEVARLNAKREKVVQEATERERQIVNDRKTQLELLKDEATMTGRISKEIAGIVSSGFGDLFDTLTDRTESWGDKFKSLGDNLMKQLGRVGWEMIFGGIKDKIVSALTRKSRERQEQQRAEFVQGTTIGDITSGSIDVNKLTNQELMKKMMEQSSEFEEVYRNIEKGILGEFDVSNEKAVLESRSDFRNLLGSKDFDSQALGGAIQENAEMGIEGVARNTSLMAEFAERQLEVSEKLLNVVESMEFDKGSISEEIDNTVNEDHQTQAAKDYESGVKPQRASKEFTSIDGSGKTHYWYDGRYHSTPKSENSQPQEKVQQKVVTPAPAVNLPAVKASGDVEVNVPVNSKVEKPVEPKEPSRKQIGMNKGDIIDLGDTKAGRRYNNVRGNIPEALLVNENTTGKKKKEDGYYGRMPVSNFNIEGAPSSLKDNIDALNNQQQGKKYNDANIIAPASSPASIQDNIDYLMNQQAFKAKGTQVASTDLSSIGIASPKVDTESQKRVLGKMDTAEKHLLRIAEAVEADNIENLGKSETNDPVIDKAKKTVDKVSQEVAEETTTPDTPVPVVAKPKDTKSPVESLNKPSVQQGVTLAQQAGIVPSTAQGGGTGANVTNTLSSALMSSGNPYAMAAGAALPLLYGLFKGKEKPKRYNKGVSAVPGNGTTDSVPALLTPGEAVLTNAAVERLGGKDFIEAANFGRMEFLHKNTGGMIDRGHALLLNKGGVVKPTSLGMKKMEKPLRSSHTALEAAKYNQMTENQRSIENFANSADGSDTAMTGRKLQEDNTLKIEYSSKTIAGVNYVTEDTFQRGLESSIARAQQNMMKGLKNSTRTRKQLGL